MKTLEKGLEIINLLATEKREMGVIEISKKLEINKSTVTKLLAVFLAHEYVSKSASTGKYFLGMKCVVVGEVAGNMNGIVDIAYPFMEELSRDTGETVNLAVRDGFYVYYIDIVRSHNNIAVQNAIGKREHLHGSSVGKVLLAPMPYSFLKEFAETTGLPRLYKNTITDFDILQKELKNVLALGFARDNEESEEAVRCVGAPIRNHNGDVIAAMSISGITMRFTEENEKVFLDLLLAATKKISGKFGYKG